MEVKPFHTSDTPQAVFLIISGVKLHRLDTSQFPAVFIFKPKTSEENSTLNDLIMAWDNGYAEGNCHAWFKTYRNILHRIKSAYPEKNF